MRKILILMFFILLSGCLSADDSVDNARNGYDDGINIDVDGEIDSLEEENKSKEILNSDYSASINILIEYYNEALNKAPLYKKMEIIEEIELIFDSRLRKLDSDINYILENESIEGDKSNWIESTLEARKDAILYTLEVRRDYHIELIEMYYENPNLLTAEELDIVRKVIDEINSTN